MSLYPHRLLQKLRPLICPFEPLEQRVPKGAAVLDVGCGTGAFLLYLAQAGRIYSGMGVDISSAALVAARSAWESLRRTGGCSLEFHAAEELCEEERRWDMVTMVDVLHHIPPASQREFVEHAFRFVKPGGFFLYKDMCCRPWWRAGMSRLHDLVVAAQWIHYVPLGDVISWVEQAGGKRLEECAYSRLWYGHELVLFRRKAA